MTENDEPKFKKVIIEDADGIDEFLSDTVSEDVYPALCLAKPPYRNSDNGSFAYLSYFDVVMYVICKTKNDDYGTTDNRDLVKQDLERAEELVTEFGSKLHQYNRYDESDTNIDFSWNDWTAEPVKLLGSDLARGYEVKFRLGLPTHQALNPAIV